MSLIAWLLGCRLHCERSALLVQAAQCNSVPLQCSSQCYSQEKAFPALLATSSCCVPALTSVAALSAASGLWSRFKWGKRSRGKGMGAAFLSNSTDWKAHQSRVFLLTVVIEFSITIHSISLTIPIVQISKFWRFQFRHRFFEVPQMTLLRWLRRFVLIPLWRYFQFLCCKREMQPSFSFKRWPQSFSLWVKLPFCCFHLVILIFPINEELLLTVAVYGIRKKHPHCCNLNLNIFILLSGFHPSSLQ